MRKRSILLVAGALAILASLVVGPATAGSERASAGTVVIVHDQEPPTLRSDWEDNNLTATAIVVNNIFSGRRGLQRECRADPAAVDGHAEAGEAEPRHRYVYVQADGGVE